MESDTERIALGLHQKDVAVLEKLVDKTIKKGDAVEFDVRPGSRW